MTDLTLSTDKRMDLATLSEIERRIAFE